MNCSQCGREGAAGASFCSGCGADLRARCGGCGRISDPGARFCAGCGNELATNAAGSAPSEAAPLLRGERRIATVLFSDLSGYTALGEQLDPEEVAQILGEIKDAATRSIESHGGTVNQFVGDEVMALFGIPVAHDDDARRAVAAGLEIHEFVRELSGRTETRLAEPLRMHTGVYTGLVVAQLRDTRDGVYAATGDAVNTAARLLSSAGPDDVFVGDETHERIAPYFETEPVGELQLKGKAEAVPAFRVTGTTGIRSRFEVAAARGLSPLVGRSEEWRLLERLLAESGERARFAHLVGEAGVGKSRLAHEFCSQAEAKGRTLLRGSCQASGSVIPYLPFIEAIRRFVDIRPDDGPEEIVDRVVEAAQALGPEAESHVPVFLHLLSVDSPAHPMPAAITPEELPRAIRDALLTALQQIAAQGPVVLHLEDWHWADEASTGILPLLGRGLLDHRVLILVDHRPAKEPNWLELEAERLELVAFGADATRQLVASCLGAAEVQSDLLALIADRTGGNPFFIEEVCTSLRQQDVLVLRGDEVRARGRIEELEIPSTVQAVLESRIDLLEPESRDVLRIASVIGSEVSLRVLERLTPEALQLDQHMVKLEQLGFLQPRLAGPDPVFQFRHVTVQEVAYETMLRRERSSVHARVGEVLEEIHGAERLNECVEALAHHYRLAGNENKALVFLEQAAWKAAGSYAFAQSREHFVRAIEILEKRQDEDDEAARKRIDLCMHWAEVNLFGPSLEQIERLERARDRAMALGDPERIVTLMYWICWVYYAVGEQVPAIERLEQVVEMVRPAGDDAILGMMMLGLGHSYAVARDSRAVAALEEGLALRSAASEGGEGVDDAHVLDAAGALDSFSQCQLALTASYQDGAANARQGFRDAIVRVRKTGVVSTESSNWITFGLASVVLGDWETAIEASHEARRIAEHVGAGYHLDTSDGIEGYALFQLGDRRAGALMLQRGVERLEKSGALLSMSLTLACYADVLAELGDLEEARFRAEAALERGDHGDRLGEDLAHRVLYRLDVQEEAAIEIEARRRALLRQADAYGCRREHALAELEIARGDEPGPERDARSAAALATLRELDLPGLVGVASALA